VARAAQAPDEPAADVPGGAGHRYSHGAPAAIRVRRCEKP
jgi:hypothetical protein